MNEERARIEAALARDPQACRLLIAQLTPIIRRRVSRVLQRAAARTGQAVRRSDVLDLTQEVFVALLKDQGQTLRRWDPERGLSLANFVGMVADREAGAIQRSGRRGGWAEDPTEQDVLESSAGWNATQPEHLAADRQQLQLLLVRLEERLSPRSYAMFEALYVDERSVDDVAHAFDTTPAALYSFRSRLRAEVEALRVELSEPDQTFRSGVRV